MIFIKIMDFPAGPLPEDLRAIAGVHASNDHRG